MAEKKEYIDRNEFLDSLPVVYGGRMVGKTMAIEIVEKFKKFPVVDAVEVVRCKDCKFCEKFYNGTHLIRECDIHEYLCSEDDFCSFGVKEAKHHCGECKYFLGGGDWNLCCSLPHPEALWGFLCYEDTGACERFAMKDEVDDGDREIT